MKTQLNGVLREDPIWTESCVSSGCELAHHPGLLDTAIDGKGTLSLLTYTSYLHHLSFSRLVSVEQLCEQENENTKCLHVQMYL